MGRGPEPVSSLTSAKMVISEKDISNCRRGLQGKVWQVAGDVMTLLIGYDPPGRAVDLDSLRRMS